MGLTKHQLVIFAARPGNIALLRDRVAAGGDVNYFDPRYGAALIEAIRSARLPTIEWLLDNGADVNAEYHDQIGPLEVALRHPEPDVVHLLLRAGARLRKRTRPYYAARLEECLKSVPEQLRSRLDLIHEKRFVSGDA
jgi:ankyrin repeat protein